MCVPRQEWRYDGGRATEVNFSALSGNPAILRSRRPADRRLCVPIFRRVCFSRDTNQTQDFACAQDVCEFRRVAEFRRCGCAATRKKRFARRCVRPSSCSSHMVVRLVARVSPCAAIRLRGEVMRRPRRADGRRKPPAANVRKRGPGHTAAMTVRRCGCKRGSIRPIDDCAD
jgi:hypothetical protein